MLNLFPIQFLSLFAHTILRVVVGIVLIHLGLSKFIHRSDYESTPLPLFLRTPLFWFVALLELVSGVMFLVGFYTQLAALASMLLSILFMVWNKRVSAALIPRKLFYFLLFGASLSLFITGAGFFAFDLPI